MLKEKIYGILASNPKYTWNYTYCTPEGINAVLDYLRDYCRYNWDYEFSSHPDELGAAVAITWIDDDGLQLLMLSQRCKEGMM